MGELLFPQKLHKLLDENLFEDIISWQHHGRSFKIHKQGDFIKKVYPIYFKNNVKYPSFQRQLSYYGFRRQGLRGPDKGSYYHPHFLRGCFSLCSQQVNRYVERREKEADENVGPEPKFYLMTPLPSLPNQKKSKADKEEFNTRRSRRDHLHDPFMTMMGPNCSSNDLFHSDTNEYYPRYGHKEWYYPNNTVEPLPLQRDGWKHEVSNFYYAPSLSYDHDGRQNYHDTSADLYHNLYGHHIMIENETASSRNKEMRDASLANGYYNSHDSHGTHFDNNNATVPIHSTKSRNIPRRHCSFIPNRTNFRGEKKREHQSSSRKSNVVHVEPPSLLPVSLSFDDETRDPIESAVAFPSSKNLNEAYSTMMVPGAARKSDPSLLAGEEGADRSMEEKALLNEATRCINRDSFDSWDEAIISSSFSSFSW